MSPNLARRIAVAMVGIPIVIGLVFWGVWPLAALVAVLAVLGTAEVYGLSGASGVEAHAVWGYVGAGLLPLYAAWAVGQAHGAGAVGAFGAALWLIGLFVLGIRRGPEKTAVAALGVTLLGAAYAGGLLAFIVVLRGSALAGESRLAATALVFFPLVLTWLLDTFAMTGGAALGGPRLAPVVSPKKTWSGALVGGGAALVLAPAYGRLVLPRFDIDLRVSELLVIGLAVAVVAQVGDLAESVLKRAADKKDASNLIPGHGGVLDRLDSLYFVLPVTTLLLLHFGGV